MKSENEKKIIQDTFTRRYRKKPNCVRSDQYILLEGSLKNVPEKLPRGTSNCVSISFLLVAFTKFGFPAHHIAISALQQDRGQVENRTSRKHGARSRLSLVYLHTEKLRGRYYSNGVPECVGSL